MRTERHTCGPCVLTVLHDFVAPSPPDSQRSGRTRQLGFRSFAFLLFAILPWCTPAGDYRHAPTDPAAVAGLRAIAPVILVLLAVSIGSACLAWMRRARSRAEISAEHLPVMMYRSTSGPARRMLHASAHCFDLAGRTPCELLADNAPTWDSLIHPEDREHVERTIDAARPATMFRARYRLLHPNGAVIAVEDMARKIPGTDGRPDVIEGIIVESGERNRQERQLRQASETLQSVLDSATQHAILATDREMRVTHVNRAAAQMLESTTDDLVGRNLLDVQSRYRIDPSKLGQVLRTIARQGRWETTITLQPSRGGADRKIHCVITPMRNAEHQDIGHVLLAYDITQQLEAQRELHAARRTAESANVSKTAFLATMSHEIRTPMTAILGYIELLEDAGPRCTCSANAELIGHLRTISRNARHLLSVVDNILDLSKIEAGRLQIAHARCNPAEMLSDLHDLFSSQAARDGIDFSVTAATPLPEFILSDATRLRQILFNLVSNAFKFTATGSIRVSAAYWPAEAPTLRPRFEIEIADTGAGMNSVQLARLFERFSHSSEARQRAQHGSGLGLALSRELARALGGDLVLVETAPGIGTRMRVTLDPGIMSDIATAEVQLPLVPSARKPGPAPEHADNSLAGRRILVVDDGPDNQRLLGYFLRRAGASTYFASNGAEAVEQVQAATPSFDAIVMDIQMPVLDGRDATRKLREHGCDIPILACSAHGCDGERDLCTAAGCDDYMPKPVVRGALVERIVKLLAEHASRKTATHST